VAGITAFRAKTGRAVSLNDRFDVRGEPMARAPKDVFRCLTATEIEMLVIGNHIVYKDSNGSIVATLVYTLF
jgi:carbamoyltransferase